MGGRSSMSSRCWTTVHASRRRRFLSRVCTTIVRIRDPGGHLDGLDHRVVGENQLHAVVNARRPGAFSPSLPQKAQLGHPPGWAPMRITRRFSACQFIAPVRSNRPDVKQARFSPIFLPLSHTAVPNWALLTTSGPGPCGPARKRSGDTRSSSASAACGPAPRTFRWAADPGSVSSSRRTRGSRSGRRPESRPGLVGQAGHGHRVAERRRNGVRCDPFFHRPRAVQRHGDSLAQSGTTTDAAPAPKSRAARAGRRRNRRTCGIIGQRKRGRTHMILILTGPRLGDPPGQGFHAAMRNLPGGTSSVFHQSREVNRGAIDRRECAARFPGMDVGWALARRRGLSYSSRSARGIASRRA